MTSPWLIRHAPRPHAEARLFCFPHAGVGASVYRSWPGGLHAGLEVWAVQPPGRETRMSQRPLASISTIVAAVVPEILPHLDRPFALFGHSMGAVVAAEVARALVEQGGPAPRHLLVSGRRPPHMPGLDTPFHHLPDAQFVAEINRRYGGIPVEVLREAELMALLLPCLRADIKALEMHRPSPRPPIPVPITAFGGADDRLAPREHIEAWRGETSATFRARIFPGGHFYLEARRAELLADIAATLAPITAAGGI